MSVKYLHDAFRRPTDIHGSQWMIPHDSGAVPIFLLRQPEVDFFRLFDRLP